MKKSTFVFAALVVSISMAARLSAQSWLHVHVEDNNGSEHVRINLPLSFVESALPILDRGHVFRHGRIHMHHHDMDVQDLKKMWAALKASGDGEFVTIDEPDVKMAISIQGENLVAKSAENSKTYIDIKIPTRVVDALLSSPGPEVNLSAAIEALKSSGAKDIVLIRDDESTVRVWID